MAGDPMPHDDNTMKCAHYLAACLAITNLGEIAIKLSDYKYRDIECGDVEVIVRLVNPKDTLAKRNNS